MKIRTREKNGVCILDCEGELTLSGGDVLLRETLKRAVQRGERKIVLNYTGLRYMDSAGVGETVACSKRALERSGVIKILMPADGVIPRIFDITGLERAFELFTDEEGVVDSFWP